MWYFAIPIEEEPVTELTIAEIAEKLGISAVKLRIKE
jgi:CO/xanthine dehydrogenase Mo-binding subunit